MACAGARESRLLSAVPSDRTPRSAPAAGTRRPTATTQTKPREDEGRRGYRGVIHLRPVSDGVLHPRARKQERPGVSARFTRFRAFLTSAFARHVLDMQKVI